MNTTRKFLTSLLVVGALGGAAAFGAFSAFSDTTSNPGNSFAAGSVTISDNDSGTALYNVSGKKPGDYAERCIKVTYTGSLPSTVKLYRSTFTGGTGLDSYIDLAITKGTGNQGDCSDFSGSTSVYSGTLNAMGIDFTGGVSLTNAGGSTTWNQNDAVTYKVRATLQDNNSANGKVTGTHSFTWEAQNT
jgi:hypothetical protein